MPESESEGKGKQGNEGGAGKENGGGKQSVNQEWKRKCKRQMMRKWRRAVGLGYQCFIINCLL